MPAEPSTARPAIAREPSRASADGRRRVAWFAGIAVLVVGLLCNVVVGWGGAAPLHKTDTSGALWIVVLAAAPLAFAIAALLLPFAVCAFVLGLWARAGLAALLALGGGALTVQAALGLWRQIAPALR